MTTTQADPYAGVERRKLVLPDIEVPAEPGSRAGRLVSLDIFRGLTIAAMLLVNNPGSWAHKYGPLGHADWHGWTPTDLIFPFFLFIVGVAIPFSMSKRSSAGAGMGELLIGIWGRAVALVLLGLLLQGIPSAGIDPLDPQFQTLRFLRIATWVIFPLGFIMLLFPWRSRKLAAVLAVLIAMLLAALAVAIHYANKQVLASGLPESFGFGNGIFTPYKWRLPGVLQRIGVCYGVAATIALFVGWRGIVMAAALLMAIYSAAMFKLPMANHQTGSLTKEDNLARRIDERVFRQHNYNAYPDPEGLLSTLPAIGTVLLGILVGIGLRFDGMRPEEKAARVLTWGVATTIVGVLLSWWLMPINKQIWTPSFTVLTAGLGMMGLGAVYYIADVRGRRTWGWPFKVFGMNAIAAFVIAGLIGRLGGLVKIKIAGGDTVGLIQFCKDHVYGAVRRFNSILQDISPHVPQIDTPNNLSLAYAISFVLAVGVILTIMYVCRVFLKV